MATEFTVEDTVTVLVVDDEPGLSRDSNHPDSE